MKAALILLSIGVVAHTATAADCQCPPGEYVRQLATAHGSGKSGLVACGQSEASAPTYVRASSLEIYDCKGTNLLSFDVAETEILYPASDRFRVVLVSTYPAGKHWQNLEVPVAEWVLLAGHRSKVVTKPRFPKPKLTAKEISIFLRQYRRWLAVARDERDWSHADEILAKLASAAFFGDPVAVKLFLKGDQDAGFDAGLGEAWGLYKFEYRLVHPDADAPR